MVKMLQKAGIRIDGIGIQGHWGLNYPRTEYIEAAIDAYAALGLKVMITELDVDVLPLTKEGQIIGTGMAHPQFQLEEFKQFLDPYPNGLPAENQITSARDMARIGHLMLREGEWRGALAILARLHVVGEPAPGTMLEQEAHTLLVEAPAIAIPERIDASVEGLEAVSHVYASQLELPENVTLIADPETLVVSVVVPIVAEEPETAEAAEAAPAAEAAAEESAE